MFKKIVKKVFNLFGLNISKLPQNRNLEKKKVIEIKIGEYKIKLTSDHALPKILEKYPNYSSNLPRIASKVKEKYTDLSLIDVGANVGDTVALLRNKDYFPIACIEGDDGFFEFLQNNIKQFRDVTTFKYFLGDKSNSINAEIEKKDGTARIIKSNNKIKFITLDDFTKLNPQFKSAKILKIDTDGYDIKIINGGLSYIQNTKPILFFEYDEVYLSEMGDDITPTLQKLKEIGYNKIMFFDNYGRFLLSTKLNETELIKQLQSYITNKGGAFQYYDVCLFHNEDNEIVDIIINNELEFNKL